MARSWLITWTTYGTWLPGDRRGFVSNVADDGYTGVRHNVPGEECDADHPALQGYMRSRLVGDPIFLDAEQAVVLLKQFKETAAHRGWDLHAVAIMRNHVHLVVTVPGDPEPDTMLRDFKSYGSRALNRRGTKPASGTWWTESGSKRKLPSEAAVSAAVQYVLNQHAPLVVWQSPSTASGGRHEPASGGRKPPVVEEPVDQPRGKR